MTGTRPGDELLQQDQGRGGPPAIGEIIRRERRRVRRWVVATATLWTLAAAYLFGLLSFYAYFLHPVMHEFFTGGTVDPQSMQPRMAIVAKLLLASLYWPGLLALAAASTLFLTLASRRATLRQIQASLAEISAQLREMEGGK